MGVERSNIYVAAVAHTVDANPDSVSAHFCYLIAEEDGGGAVVRMYQGDTSAGDLVMVTQYHDVDVIMQVKPSFAEIGYTVLPTDAMYATAVAWRDRLREMFGGAHDSVVEDNYSLTRMLVEKREDEESLRVLEVERLVQPDYTRMPRDNGLVITLLTVPEELLKLAVGARPRLILVATIVVDGVEQLHVHSLLANKVLVARAHSSRGKAVMMTYGGLGPEAAAVGISLLDSYPSHRKIVDSIIERGAVVVSHSVQEGVRGEPGVPDIVQRARIGLQALMPPPSGETHM